MDMKRILQALDGAATKPVAGANDMSNFLRIVTEGAAPAPAAPQQDPNFAKYAELMAKYDMLAAEMTPDASGVAKNSSPAFVQQVNALKAQADQLAGANAQAWEQARKAGSAPQQSQQQIATQLEEGANPHKVSLPVQMAMQHYATPKSVAPKKQSLLKQYFAEAEAAVEEQKAIEKQRINQYAHKIAQRVLVRESALQNKEDLQAKRKALQDIQVDPNTEKDPELKKELVRRKHDLEKEAKKKGLSENQQAQPAPRDARAIQQEIKAAEKEATKAEYTLAKVREVTKEIKYDDTAGSIVLRIRKLAETVPSIDGRDLKYAEEAVFEAIRALESSVYGLEEAFTDAVRHSKNKVDELESEVSDMMWQKKYGTPEAE